MADQQFCLRWNNHQSTLISVLDSLLENGTLVDCTLAAEGQYLPVHKVVLSACSPYLETLLSRHYEKHPIVILKDVKYTELRAMVDYMYRGEVNISQDQLGTFLKAAESLQIKGLSDNGTDGDARDVGSTPKGPPAKAQPAPTNRPESQRPELSPPSSAHRTRDGSISPSSRKRRRIRRNSQGDDSNMGDSHLDSNSCDLPNQAQSTPLVPNIPATVTSISATPIKATIVKPEQTDLINRIDSSNLNSLPPESGLLKEKIEAISEPLLEPKTEYLEDANNDDSVEDLTLEDDDEMDKMDMSNMSNISRPGPSHGNDVAQIANQGEGLDAEVHLDNASPSEKTYLQCRTVRIGSYKVVPKDKVLVTPHGLKFTVPVLGSDQYVELKIMQHEIIKVLMHFGRQMPVFFIYTRPTADAKIRKALRMEDKNSYYYDSTSSDETHRRITFLPDKIDDVSKSKLKNIFGNSDKNIFAELTGKEANDILLKVSPKEVQVFIRKRYSSTATTF